MKSKYRTADNVNLVHTMQQVLQIRHKIEAMCVDTEQRPDLLDKSIIPTGVLFNIAACFESMFYKLEHQGLLNAGFPKSSKTVH
jgi:hypothetical protein